MVLFVIVCVCCTLITAAATTTPTTVMVTAIKATDESAAASSSRNDWIQNRITGSKYLKYETFDDCQWWIRANGDEDVSTTGHVTLTKLTTTKKENNDFYGDDETVALVCNLRTMNDKMNTSSFSIRLPFIKKRTKSLKIECSDDEQIMSRGSLDESSFSHLSQLRELIIDNCKMAQWPTATLANLRQLRNLTIRTSNIDWKDISLQVSADSLIQVKSLEQLDLSTNNIWSLPENLFCHLTNLTALNMSKNHLQNIIELNFRKERSSSSPQEQQSPYSTLPPEVPTTELIIRISKNTSATMNTTNAINTKMEADEPILPTATTLPSPVSCNTNGSNHNIRVLDLSSNHFVLLPSHGFSALKQLQRLYLQNNKISNVADRSLAGLKNLKIIDLSGNKIVSLRWGNWFAECAESVMEIHLQNNSISQLSTDLFANLKQLTLLDLSSNQLTTTWINNETFSNLARLVRLNLSRNRIDTIGTSLLRDLHSLQILNLDHNGLETIPANAFTTLTNLHTLTISHNHLKILQMRLLNGLLALNMLSVEFNQIEFLDETVLRDCCADALTDLNLSGNKLKRVPAVALRGMHSLKTLDLSRNRIESLEKDDLDLINFGFKGVENKSQPRAKITLGNNLQELRLVGNRIATIRNGTFEKLTSLRILNLSQNRIQMIEKEVFITNAKLEAIRADANELIDVDEAFSSARALISLNVSNNRIRRFDYNSFAPTLQILDVHGNAIEELPIVMASPIRVSTNTSTLTSTSTSIADSDIGYTRTRSTNAAIRRPYTDRYYDKNDAENAMPGYPSPRLRVLNASFNRIKRVEGAAIPATIEILSLHNNQIESIEAYAFANKINLSRVYLHSNNIERIELVSLQLNPAIPIDRPLPQFYIGNNPFICDCTMEWLHRAKELANKLRQHPIIMDTDNIRCRLVYDRLQREYIALTTASVTQFLCPYRSHCYTLCQCCPFDACDCEMTCPPNCTCYHDSSWNANIVDCAHSGHQSLPAKIPMDTTELYLDGNVLYELASNVFIGRKNLRLLYANDSRIVTLNNYTFKGLTKLHTLHLQHNLIQMLHGYEFVGLDSLCELYLQENRIQFIHSRTFAYLKNMQVLRLDNNALNRFDVWRQFASNSYLIAISISANPWSCDCQFIIELCSWIRHNYVKIVDVQTISCAIHLKDIAGTSSHVIKKENENKNNINMIDVAINTYADIDGKNDSYELKNQTYLFVPLLKLFNLNHNVIDGIAATGFPLVPSCTTATFTAAADILRDNIVFVLACVVFVIVVATAAIMSITFAAKTAFNSYLARRRRRYAYEYNTGTSACKTAQTSRFRFHFWHNNKSRVPQSQLQRQSVFSGGHDDGVRSRMTINAGAEAERERLFDAYIVYCIKDEDFITRVLCSHMEERCCSDMLPYKLCLHFRDFGARCGSRYITDTIIEAADCSKRTIVVVSQNFILNEWSRYEYKSALQRVLLNGRNKVIFVLLGDISRFLDRDLQVYLKTNSYLEWGDASFWPKFKSLMPLPNSKEASSSTCSTASTFIMSSSLSSSFSSSSSSSSMARNTSAAAATTAANAYSTLLNLQAVRTIGITNNCDNHNSTGQRDCYRNSADYTLLPLSPLLLSARHSQQQLLPAPPLPVLMQNTRNTNRIQVGLSLIDTMRDCHQSVR